MLNICTKLQDNPSSNCCNISRKPWNRNLVKPSKKKKIEVLTKMQKFMLSYFISHNISSIAHFTCLYILICLDLFIHACITSLAHFIQHIHITLATSGLILSRCFNFCTSSCLLSHCLSFISVICLIFFSSTPYSSLLNRVWEQESH